MRDGLFELKRKWLPLFLFGVAIFGSGIALFALWLYRSSPYPRIVVDFLTTNDPASLPRGTLISLSAAAFALFGAWILVYSIRKINESEVGEIDSFWWKIAVAALAGGWWLGQPRVAVIGSGTGMPTLLRALKTFCGTITVVGDASPELVIALADDEEGVKYVLEQTPSVFETLGVLAKISDGLRLHGRFLSPDSPMAFEAVTRADAVILCPDLENVGQVSNLPYVGQVSNLPYVGQVGNLPYETVRRARGKRVLVGAVTASAEESLARAIESCAAQCGSITVLANNNFVAPLPPNRFYQSTENLRGLKDL
ncbi:MAG: hypothetical protein HZB17_10695, partial [Chloroflexi bacterium]|nr:hypothetical protein [Chloroflexota bacterium]